MPKHLTRKSRKRWQRDSEYRKNFKTPYTEYPAPVSLCKLYRMS